MITKTSDMSLIGPRGNSHRLQSSQGTSNNLNSQATYQFKFKRIASTNSFLNQIAGFTEQPVCCIADSQVEGYGQQSRRWTSQLNDITMSLMMPIVYPLPEGFSQRVALCIVETLEEYSPTNIQLKWPNDMFINNSKVGGILIERQSAPNKTELIIIGLGLNLQPPKKAEDVSYKWGWFNPNTERHILIDVIQSRLIEAFFINGVNNTQPLNVNAWHARDLFTPGQTVAVVSDHCNPQMAYYQGINLQGQAMVYYAHQQNKLVRLNSGAVSLRTCEVDQDGTN